MRNWIGEIESWENNILWREWKAISVMYRKFTPVHITVTFARANWSLLTVPNPPRSTSKSAVHWYSLKWCKHLKSWIHTRTQAFFYRFVTCAFPFFEVKSVLPIDRYQNATSKAISLHELKKVKLQEWYTLVTQDSIGHLKMLCMSVLSLVVALECEWKRYSSSQSDKKTLAFEYEFSLKKMKKKKKKKNLLCLRPIQYQSSVLCLSHPQQLQTHLSL